MNPYLPIILTLVATLIVFESYRIIVLRLAASRRASFAGIQRAFLEVVSQSSLREASLLTRARSAEADADRLALIVAQYLKDIDETATLLKDEAPPSLTAEREALRLHQSALELRT